MASLFVADRLSEWAAQAQPAREPRALAMARNAFFDLTACLLAGSRDPGVKLLIQAVHDWDGAGANLVIGTRRRHHPPWAALINATAAHALDFDDNFLPAFTHATAVIGPALLAIAETHRLGGKALLDAYLVGLELHARIGMLVNPGHFQKGWHVTATVGAIGTAGACARLLGLDARGIQTAMGIALSMAAGSKRQFGTMMKPVQAGLAAQHAIMAAGMAAVGVTAAPDFLTGASSFQSLYATADSAAEAAALAGLGQDLELLKHGLIVKRFPCCASAHKTLDGLLELRQTHAIRPERIRRVTAKLPQTLRSNLPFAYPRNEMEARFSLPYNAARILKEGELLLSHFTPAAIDDPDVARLAALVRIESVPDPSVIRMDMPVYSSIEMLDGTRYETETIHLKGSLLDPLSIVDLEKKLKDCCRFGGVDKAAQSLRPILADVASWKDVSVLTDHLWSLSAEEFASCRHGGRPEP